MRKNISSYLDLLTQSFKNHNQMKTIQLTLKEFYVFKQLAKFIYEFKVTNSSVNITADETMLAMLGY